MPTNRFRLYSAEQLQPVIDRMARQLATRLHGCDVLLIGLLRRGAPIADRLADALAGLLLRVERQDLLVKRYGDDLTLLHPDTRLTETPAQSGISLAGRHVVLVDDVLYQGHSLARVLEWTRAHHAASVTSVVLVDRLARQLPIAADIAGVTLQIAPEDVIECNVPPFEPEFAVDVMRLA